VRLARDFGDVSSLFPPDFDDLRDLPHSLFEAIRMAALFLSFDELDTDERPPKRIWLMPEQLNAWMEAVNAKRRSGSSDMDREIEDPVQNMAARDLIVGG
jgi:hypothetical protein